MGPEQAGAGPGPERAGRAGNVSQPDQASSTPERIRPDGRQVPHPSRLDPRRSDYDAIMAAHAAAVDAGSPSYRDPGTGLTALTGAELARRGSCCDSGCRHCPYVGA